MKSYLLSPQASLDLEELYEFISKDNEEAALKIINFLEERLDFIAQFPDIGRKREELAPDIKSFPVEKYVIFYRKIEQGIHVMRVLHGARDVEIAFQ
ncbi:MAG: type II toxin-antitoxin system RelE/ParE family toxin [Deltaproteobacteria bacterium]|nr:MAG: type II toxin-antitoxin system RelE/ParE family toxin [Deltaproteobacteria bacterium]